MRRAIVALLVAAAVALSLVAPASAGKGKAGVHKPPYNKGHQGGDSWNYIHADRKTGEVAVFRAFPGFSPVVGCAPEPDAGWATLTETHHVLGRIDKVIVNFEGVLEPYAWAYAGVSNAKGNSIGVAKFQGPHTGAGKLKIDLFKQPPRHSTIEIEFGAQLGDSCPQVGAAALSFPSIKID